MARDANGFKRVQVTTYEVRPLNEDGDAIDVLHYDTWNKALADAESVGEHYGAVAIVIEKHRVNLEIDAYGNEKSHSRLDRYQTMLTSGSIEALIAGGWVDK